MRLISIAEEKKIGGIDYLLASWQVGGRPIEAWIPLKDFLIIAHKASNSGTGKPVNGKGRKIKKRVKPKLVDSETERDQESCISPSKGTLSGKRNPLELPELQSNISNSPRCCFFVLPETMFLVMFQLYRMIIIALEV